MGKSPRKIEMNVCAQCAKCTYFAVQVSNIRFGGCLVLFLCVILFFVFGLCVFALSTQRKIVCGDAQKPDYKTVTSTPAMLYFPRGDGSNQTCATDLLLAPALQ